MINSGSENDDDERNNILADLDASEKNDGIFG